MPCGIRRRHRPATRRRNAYVIHCGVQLLDPKLARISELPLSKPKGLGFERKCGRAHNFSCTSQDTERPQNCRRSQRKIVPGPAFSTKPSFSRAGAVNLEVFDCPARLQCRIPIFRENLWISASRTIFFTRFNFPANGFVKLLPPVEPRKALFKLLFLNNNSRR
jgi:hypothetical protein